MGQVLYWEMQQPQRYIPSVSDLYGTDEIEFLLDEIRDLEPACCQLDDVQDFEIAGSRAGELSISLESPVGTCTSWDSHAHYRQRTGQTPLPWGVALHCDSTHLKTPTGIVRILLVVSIKTTNLEMSFYKIMVYMEGHYPIMNIKENRKIDDVLAFPWNFLLGFPVH